MRQASARGTGRRIRLGAVRRPLDIVYSSLMDERPSPLEPIAPLPEAGADALRTRLEAVADAAAVFAHDLKNPLSALLLGLQRLARLADPARQAQARELATRLERSIQATSKLVDAHADFARLQAGRLALERGRLASADVLLRAAELVKPAAAERSQELRLDLAPGLPEVDWDGDRMIQALEQVLGTALRLAPAGATASCAGEAAGADVILAVSVAWPAASPDGSSPAAPPRRIRGSGLLVARSLVEAHGGRLTVDEDAERTTVRMIVPARPSSPTPST